MNDRKKDTQAHDFSAGDFTLHTFMPYRIAALADSVSRALARIYGERFDLSRQEWRILAHLGGGAQATATEIARTCALDKMQVSRAVRRLEENGYLTRHELAGDRRNNIVRLAGAGEALYRRITPMALAREHDLLSVLSAEEVGQLRCIVDKLHARAEHLAQDDPE